MKSLFIGTAVFPCCGTPHLIYASKAPREVATAQFASALHAAEPGHGGPASQAMLTEVAGEDFLSIEAMYHDLPPPPTAQVHLLQVNNPAQLEALLQAMSKRQINSPAQLEALLQAMGKNPEPETPTPTHPAPETPQ